MTMTNRIIALSTAAVLSIAALGASAAFADESSNVDAVYGAKTIGALLNETRGLATDASAVRRQGGAASAATVRWTQPAEVHAGSVYGAKTVGALLNETRGLATDASAVRLQGGAATAATVRWTGAPAVAADAPVGVVYDVGSVGAMVRESEGVATSNAAVARQGGGVTSNAVRWVLRPAS